MLPNCFEYVQIQVGHDYGWNPKVWKTSKIKKTLNPIWNEEFIVPVSSPEKDGVRFAVFDYDMIGSDDLLGQVVFPSLHKLQLGVPTEAILNLAGVKSSRGTIHVVLTAMNFGVQPTQVVVQQNIVAPPPQQVVQQTTTYQQPMVQQQTTTTTGYATPPPANPYGAPGGNPYGAAPIPGYGAPLGAQVAQANYNPYGQQQNFNPYGQQQPQQQYNPYGQQQQQQQQQQQPQQQYNPYGQQQQPQQTYNPYGQQQQQPQQQYGGSPYGGPPAY